MVTLKTENSLKLRENVKKKIISVPLENDNITNITYDVRPIISCIAKLRTPSKT